MGQGLRRFLFSDGVRAESFPASVGLTLLRVYAGLALAFSHGLGKIPPSEGFAGMVGGLDLPVPAFFAWMSGIAEFFGGLLLALGLLTRPVALLILLNMTVVVFRFHIMAQGDPFGDYELPLFFFFAAMAFLLRGSGPLSMDAAVRRSLGRDG